MPSHKAITLPDPGHGLRQRRCEMWLVVYTHTTMPPKQRFQVLLEPVQLTCLREIEARTGAPVGEQIRRGVELWIARNKPKRRRPTVKLARSS